MTGRSTTLTLRSVDDWLTLNRQMWDERVPLHVASDFYNVEAFKSGRPILRGFVLGELGPLDGMRVLHLQCHFGLETLDLARHPSDRDRHRS